MIKTKNRSDYLFLFILKLFKGYFLYLVIFFLLRLGFLLFFGREYLSLDYQLDLLKAFYVGIKYDTVVWSYLSLPFFILSIVVSSFKSVKFFNLFQWFCKQYFKLVILLCLLIVIVDYSFFSFFQDHINILIYGFFEDDTNALIESIFKNYKSPLIITSGVIIFASLLIHFFMNSIFKKAKASPSWIHGGFLKFIFLIFFVFVLYGGGLRGGYGDLVLAPQYSDFSKVEFINQMAYNGVIALEKTVKLRNETEHKDYSLLEKYGYKGQEHKAFGDYLGMEVITKNKDELISLLKRTTSENPVLEKSPPHVVVLVMESFGANWIKYNNERFDFLGELKKHIDQDIYFPNVISSGAGTIGSMLVLGTNIPHRAGIRFISESKHLNKNLASSSNKPYEKNGYKTHFIYGGKLGWRSIGRYFKTQGFHNIVGENEIINTLGLQKNYGTEWGLFDEHLLNYIYKILSESNTPQFILALSTSNHPPFEIPKSHPSPDLQIPSKLQQKITREEDLFLKRFKAFEYSNQKLAQFLSQIKSGDLKDKTVVSFTGDHNFWGFMNYDLEEAYSKYLVPFYIYAPESLLPTEINQNKIGAHEDIMTTLYNLTLSKTEYLTWGDNLLALGKSNALGPGIYANHDGVYYKKKFYNWKDGVLLNQEYGTKDQAQKWEKDFKAIFSTADFYLDSFDSAK